MPVQLGEYRHRRVVGSSGEYVYDSDIDDTTFISPPRYRDPYTMHQGGGLADDLLEFEELLQERQAAAVLFMPPHRDAEEGGHHLDVARIGNVAVGGEYGGQNHGEDGNHSEDDASGEEGGHGNREENSSDDEESHSDSEDDVSEDDGDHDRNADGASESDGNRDDGKDVVSKDNEGHGNGKDAAFEVDRGHDPEDVAAEDGAGHNRKDIASTEEEDHHGSESKHEHETQPRISPSRPETCQKMPTNGDEYDNRVDHQPQPETVPPRPRARRQKTAVKTRQLPARTCTLKNGERKIAMNEAEINEETCGDEGNHASGDCERDAASRTLRPKTVEPPRTRRRAALAEVVPHIPSDVTSSPVTAQPEARPSRYPKRKLENDTEFRDGEEASRPRKRKRQAVKTSQHPLAPLRAALTSTVSRQQAEPSQSDQKQARRPPNGQENTPPAVCECLYKNCSMSWTNKSASTANRDRNRHMVTHWPKDDRSVWVCPACKKSLSRGDALKRHCRTKRACRQVEVSRDSTHTVSLFEQKRIPWESKEGAECLRSPRPEHRDPFAPELEELRRKHKVRGWPRA